MRKFVRNTILILLGLLILVFAVANRQIVVFTIDPFGSTDPNSALAFAMPLFALAFILVIVGVIIGGVAAWLRQHKWRKAARDLDTELRAARAEIDSLRRQLDAAHAAVVHVDAPKLAPPPPA